MVRKKKKKTITRSKKKVTKKKGSKKRVLTLPTSKSSRVNDFSEFISMFFGMPGVGKTTFVNGLYDDVLFLSTDRGTRFLDAMRVECNLWEDFENVLIKLESTRGSGYSAICIDHIADWASQGESAVLEKLQIEALTDAGYGKGWSVYKKLLERYVQRLRALDLGIIFIAHEDIKTVKQHGLDVDKVMPKMSKQAWDIIVPLCDLIGNISMKTVKDAKTKERKEIRILETSPRDELYVKDRTPRKPTLTKSKVELLDPQKFLESFSK